MGKLFFMRPLSQSCGGGGVMEMHVRVPCKPLGTAFVGAVVVKNHVQFPPLRQHCTLAPLPPHPINERKSSLFLAFVVFPFTEPEATSRAAKRFIVPVPSVGAVHSRDHGSVTIAAHTPSSASWPGSRASRRR